MRAEKHDERHKMISTNSKEENSAPNLAAGSSSSLASTTPWLRLKDPRIVRVSRAFGGKDRHSKVCTIRGLRDRRVRLSVSTAIQLYDLQDRLGLNQPSKVVDWLLNAAKDEIDELPPLPPVPSASLGLNYQSMLQAAHTKTHTPHRSQLKIDKEVEDTDADAEQKQQKSNSTNYPSHTSSFSSLLNNNVGVPAAPFGYHHWEASSSSSSTSTNLPFFTSQAEDDHIHNFNNIVNLSFPSPLSLSTASHFMDFNHFFANSNSLAHPNLHSINQSAQLRPFHFTMAPITKQNNHNYGDGPNKDDRFCSEL